jgi:RIO-like serine/threonine protein kinase
MADPESQRAYLEDIQEEINTAIKDKREAQITALGALSQAERNKLLEDDLAVLSAVRATNNAYLYEEIDELKKTSQLTEEQMAATEDLGQRILSNLSAQEAYN